MKLRPILLLATLTLVPALAQAHPGHAGHEGGIGWGLVHPFTGFDHLLAALLVGLWAVIAKGSARMLIPVSFFGCGILGAFLGMNMGAFTGLETGILASVIVFTLALVSSHRSNATLACIITCAGALFHGWAHGSEAPASATSSYLLGILISTMAITAIGALIGTLAQKRKSRTLSAAPAR